MKRAVLVVLVACSDGYTPPDLSGITVNNAGLEDAAIPEIDGGVASLLSSEAVLQFGTVLTNTESAMLTTTISNQGDASTGSSLVLGGAAPSAFTVAGDTCTGTTLQGVATCVAQVRFAPSAAGAVQATLTINGTANGSTSVVLKGTGAVAGALGFTPSAGAFGNVAAAASGDVSIALQNVGTTQTGAITVDVSGVDAALFQLTANNCAGGLAAGATCGLVVRFSPTTTGARSATLTASDALGGAMTAALSGNGT